MVAVPGSIPNVSIALRMNLQDKQTVTKQKGFVVNGSILLFYFLVEGHVFKIEQLDDRFAGQLLQ